MASPPAQLRTVPLMLSRAPAAAILLSDRHRKEWAVTLRLTAAQALLILRARAPKECGERVCRAARVD